ncbi:unnamed protein product [Pocillopora meandrina]|uniref:Uncharacterized protein n=1 Tax=Pocillopora meandrina TaxID=46732 RepID=A0AAU9WAQ1_9CNID|nr:unnamed protein product [Pocillopora meandrina]
MFHGVNFPADGPKVGKRTTDWDPSFEKMTVSSNILRGDMTMFLLLKGGGYYRAKEPVTLPSNHVVEHRIVRNYLDDEDGMKV